MNKQKDEKWLDELISRTINTTKPQFDPDRWKQKYPEEFETLKSHAGQRTSIAQPSIWKNALQSRLIRFAAAAVIIIAIGLFIVHRGPDEQVKPTDVAKVAKSAAEMMTVGSLNTVYRQGGFDAVQRHLEMISEMKGSRQRQSITLSDILVELNGNGHERR